MVATSTCPVCDSYGHDFLTCPICKQPFGCPNKPVYIVTHVNSSDCTAYQCPQCGLVDKSEHMAPCATCGEPKNCPKDACPSGCCVKCGQAPGSCHCKGPCDDPYCVLKSSQKQEYFSGYPQHKANSLGAYGLLHKDHAAVSLYDQAVVFYASLALQDGSKYRDVLMRGMVRRIAESLSEAILLACAGELRYTHKSLHVGAAALSDASRYKWGRSTIGHGAFEMKEYEYRRPFGLGKFYQAGDKSGWGGGRTGSARLFRAHVINRHGKKHAARVMRNAFMLQYYASGKGGMGGPIWAKAADVAYRYFSGQLSDVLFVDSAFDLQHNNANLFTKSHRIPKDFEAWLNKRQEEDEDWVIAQAPRWLLDAFGVKQVGPTTCTYTGTAAGGIAELDYIDPQPLQMEELSPTHIKHSYVASLNEVLESGLKPPAHFASKTNKAADSVGGIILEAVQGTTVEKKVKEY